MNNDGRSFSLQIQPYAMGNDGKQNWNAYPVKVVAVNQAGEQEKGYLDWPSCDASTEGVRIKVYTEGGTQTMVYDRFWAGIHCTGKDARYVVTIQSSDLLFGAYAA